MLVFNAPYPTAGASFPTYRYFKLNVTGVTGFSFVDLTDFAIASSAGGASLVLSKTISSVPSGTGGQPIAALVDGSTSGAWESTALPVAITIDMGAGNAFTPAELRLSQGAAAPPRDFELLGSNDNTTFTSLASWTGITWSLATQTYSISSATPIFSVAPSTTTDTGFYGVGDTATVTFAHNGTSTTIRWLRDGVAIGGATSATYTYVSADAGHTVTAEATASNWAGSTVATTAHAIVTPTFATTNRVTSSGATRLTSSGATRVTNSRAS